MSEIIAATGIDMSEVVNDPDFTQPFEIHRITGAFGEGGWIPTVGGKITTISIDPLNKGVGYHINDVVTIVQAGASGGTIKVLSIGVGGTIETIQLLTPGTQYITANGLSTTVLPSGGSGAKANIMASIFNPEIIPCMGIVSVMSQKELDMFPEGDRIKGAMIFHSATEIKTTRAGANSDQIKWQGEMYRIFNIWPYETYGYCKAAAVRMESM